MKNTRRLKYLLMLPVLAVWVIVFCFAYLAERGVLRVEAWLEGIGADAPETRVDELEGRAEEEAVPEPEPAKPEPKPDPEPEPAPAPKQEPKQEPKPAPKPAPKPEPKPAPKPEPKPAPKPALKEIADGNYLLALVTKQTTLGRYAPSDLVRIPQSMRPSRELYLRKEAFTHLEKLMADAERDGVKLSIVSAYRSYSYQEVLFNRYAKQHGEKEANRFSARPGQSEHQLGTTIDFGGTSVDLTTAYGDTLQGRWLAENAYKYGFVMSYPPGMEAITGYIYEPWHYRYIGVEEALKWKESGLVLCKYLEQKPQYFK